MHICWRSLVQFRTPGLKHDDKRRQSTDAFLAQSARASVAWWRVNPTYFPYLKLWVTHPETNVNPQEKWSKGCIFSWLHVRKVVFFFTLPNLQRLASWSFWRKKLVDCCEAGGIFVNQVGWMRLHFCRAWYFSWTWDENAPRKPPKAWGHPKWLKLWQDSRWVWLIQPMANLENSCENSIRFLNLTASLHLKMDFWETILSHSPTCWVGAKFHRRLIQILPARGENPDTEPSNMKGFQGYYPSLKPTAHP